MTLFFASRRERQRLKRGACLALAQLSGCDNSFIIAGQPGGVQVACGLVELGGPSSWSAGGDE